MSHNLQISTSLGDVIITDFSFKSRSEIKHYAHSTGFNHHEDDEATLYCRILLQNSCTLEDGEGLNNEQLAKLSIKEIADFAAIYYHGIFSEASEEPDYIKALYEYIVSLEVHYKKKMRVMHSPFSEETTMSSLSSMESHQSALREIWENEYVKDEKLSVSQKIQQLLKLKDQFEDTSSKQAPSKNSQEVTLLTEIIHILHERNTSEFKRSIETKRVVNRNLIFILTNLSLASINLTFNILRLFNIIN
ncbi:MAG: hypothetical protein FWE37_03540 [Spirochaetaceae bacterium]|nr:hypothetical protein [Spirochaetaceae bacterium]